MVINIDNYFNYKIANKDKRLLLSQLKKINQSKIFDIEFFGDYLCKRNFTKSGSSHLDTINSKLDKLFTIELKRVILILDEIKPLLFNSNNNDLTCLVFFTIISEIQDLVSSLDLILNQGNFISGYGLIRNLKERVLNVMIINEDKDKRAKIYHSYYQNFLRDFHDKDIEGNNGNWWFKEIPEYKDNGISSLMDKFGIIGYHFNSQYSHGNFGTYTETPYHSYSLLLGEYGIEQGKEEYLSLFFEDYYPIHLEIVALLIDMFNSFKNDELNNYIEYLSFIHKILIIKANKYLGFYNNNK